MIITRLFGLILAIVISPFLFMVSVIIYFDGGRPIIFKQKRVGVRNELFKVYKFRTMKNGIPDIPTHLVESPDSLYTKIGPLLRKLSIDELPQLINIIRGEMVFVGPRPALYNQNDLIELRTQVGIDRLMPGVTGWAQINGRDELSISEKVQYDEYYLINHSLFFDLKIVALTILRVAGMKGISH